jgi:pyrroloquinoline quinone biosynthesis protein B
VDVAFIDATFYDAGELNNRDMSEIPHPFVVESFKRFDCLDAEQRGKIKFIHLNHSNPLLNTTSKEYKHTISKGYDVAAFMERLFI